MIFDHLGKKIDGVPKHDLFHIAVLLHDIGKWARKVKLVDGIQKADYSFHEDIGASIVAGNHDFQEVNKFLNNNLSIDQINYIASCVSKHYELGKLRSAFKKQALAYDLETPKKTEFSNAIAEIVRANQNYKVEIGLFFLIDNLGKTTHYFRYSTMLDSEVLSGQVKKFMLENNKPEILRDAYLETPVTYLVGNCFLESLL